MELSRRSLLRTGLFGATALTVLPGSLALAQTVCAAQSCTITAGQTIDVGTMTVSNDNINLYISFTLDGDVVFDPSKTEQVKIWVGTDFTNMPQTPGGNPIPGQFPYKSGSGGLPAASGSSYSITIPLVDAGIILPAGCNSTLHIVAHLDVSGDSIGRQTAFGGCSVGATGRRWWFFMDYVICCPSGDPPPVLGDCETAFAKGQWVWTTDPKANPEILSSLRLIKNRWGWAINLTAAGITHYPIYAGAGLNKISNGTLVGTLTINWFDSDDPEDGVPDTVVITYELLNGYRLAETHVYASPSPPTTTAPGQYGNLNYYSACENVSSDQYILPLVDNPGSFDTCKQGAGPLPCKGVWIIAHAVVCDAAVCNP